LVEGPSAGSLGLRGSAGVPKAAHRPVLLWLTVREVESDWLVVVVPRTALLLHGRLSGRITSLSLTRGVAIRLRIIAGAATWRPTRRVSRRLRVRSLASLRGPLRASWLLRRWCRWRVWDGRRLAASGDRGCVLREQFRGYGEIARGLGALRRALRGRLRGFRERLRNLAVRLCLLPPRRAGCRYTEVQTHDARDGSNERSQHRDDRRRPVDARLSVR
jgi:hypothetical protein